MITVYTGKPLYIKNKNLSFFASILLRLKIFLAEKNFRNNPARWANPARNPETVKSGINPAG